MVAEMADRLQDRQDAPIWNAIEANNLKQALKLVDKRLAKKHTQYLEALKIFIRSRFPLATEKGAVLVHLEELVERKPPVTDIEAIELYDEAFEEILPNSGESWGRTIGELRWQCVKGLPKNEEVGKKCFEACLAKKDLEHAKQISNSLEKSFINNHAYIFWNIATMSLYSISPNYPEKQRKLWGSLAYAQIGKLATATKQAADPKKLPVRSIHTPQELLLLHKIAEAHGKPEQRLEYLQDPNLGPESVVAKGEWQLWRLKLQLLEAAQHWQELFDTTKTLLKRARTQDPSGQLSESGMSDWIVWEAFIRSAIELQGSKLKDLVYVELEAHLDPACKIDKSWKRNASLAFIKISFENHNTFALGAGSSEDRVGVVLKYLKQYGSATTAFNDLRPFVEQLDTEERKALLDNLSSHALFGNPGHAEYDASKTKGDSASDYAQFKTANKLTEHINTYKLRYLLTSSLPEHKRRQNPENLSGQKESSCTTCSQPCFQFCSRCLKDLAQDVAKLYLSAVDGGREAWNLLATDRHPADDLAVLSAMCLIKLSKIDDQVTTEPLANVKTSYILQAVALLEHAGTLSQPNFQIWLMLIRLYTYLGCGSMAAHVFDNLALKQVQLDTLSYTLFDRISSFHPHVFGPVQDTEFKPPLESLKRQQKVYRQARDQVSRNTWLSYQHGNYSTIFELREVSERLECSVASIMSVIETRRITRLAEPNVHIDYTIGGYDILASNPGDESTPIFDNNDYATYPNFESTLGPSFEELSRDLPGPSVCRTRRNLHTETLLDIIHPLPSNANKNQFAAKQAALHLFTSSSLAPLSLKEASAHLSQTENLAQKCYDAMSLIVHETFSPSRSPEETSPARLEAASTDLCVALKALYQHTRELPGKSPAFGSDLHTLYIAWNVSTAGAQFWDFLDERGEGKKEKSMLIQQSVMLLSGAVLMNCAALKKGMDEGGWIDKVLEAAMEGESVLGPLRDLLDEGAIEVWAGDVTQSWEDSVVGLGMLMKAGGL